MPSAAGGVSLASAPAYHISTILRLFIERLLRRQDPKLLDVGPICAENINLLARQTARLYVCDMFIRIDRERERTGALRSVWRHLDYPDKSFDGILLWDLLDRLDDSDVASLLERCHSILKQGGMLVVFFFRGAGGSGVGKLLLY